MTRDLLSLLTMILVIGYSWATACADTVTLLHQAAYRYEVPNSLLLAIAYVESKGVLTALNIQGEEYYPVTWQEGETLLDRHAQSQVLGVGVMQIEVPVWGQRLQLSAQTLYQPQVNVPVAAYVLRRCIDDSGGDLWKGVGCYHSPTNSNQRRYVRRVWSAYTTLRQRGTFGPTLASTTDTEPDRPSSVIRVGMTIPPSRPMVPSGGRYPLPSLSQWRPPSAGLPTCAGQQPQRRSITGKGRLTLVFFSPGQPWPELGETPRALVMGMCVECRLGELLPLSTALGHPVQVAAPALLAQLQVTCLPTVIELTNASPLNEVQP